MKQNHKLHVVTDAQLTPGRSHEDVAMAAVEAGAPLVQLRDKLLPDRDFYQVALAIRDITRRAGALLIVNDRVDIGVAADADGVHVGQTDMPASAVRRLIGPDLILGVSAGSLDEALRAEADGADYIGFSPVFSTATKEDAGKPTGLELLEEVSSAVHVPIVAIGGINEDNIRAVVEAGAYGAAVVSAIVCAQDMRAAVRRLMSLMDSAT